MPLGTESHVIFRRLKELLHLYLYTGNPQVFTNLFRKLITDLGMSWNSRSFVLGSVDPPGMFPPLLSVIYIHEW